MENILTKICNTKKDEIVEQKKIHNKDFFIESFSQLPVANKFLFKKNTLRLEQQRFSCDSRN